MNEEDFDEEKFEAMATQNPKESHEKKSPETLAADKLKEPTK